MKGKTGTKSMDEKSILQGFTTEFSS